MEKCFAQVEVSDVKNDLMNDFHKIFFLCTPKYIFIFLLLTVHF